MALVRNRSKKSLALFSAVMIIAALAIPLAGAAVAAPTGITITPTSDTAVVGTCNQYTVNVPEDTADVPGGSAVTLSISQTDTANGTPLTIDYCDPDGAGPPGVDAGLPQTGTDNGGTVTAPGACTTLANNTCVIGVSSTEAGTMNISGEVTLGNGNQQTATATKTWVAGGPNAVTAVDCEPETDNNPEGTAHSFTCTAFTGANNDIPVSGVNIVFDVTAGPNSEEVTANTACVPPATDNNGETVCSYTDTAVATSLPGTDTIVGYVNKPCPRAGANPCGTGVEADEAQDEISKTFVGESRNIDCEPETASNPPASVHTVTCTVTDTAGNPVPLEIVDFSETGVGRFEDGTSTATDTTDDNGEATADTTTFANETGDQTITGTIDEAVTDCELLVDDPNTGDPAGNCTDDVTKTWEIPDVTTGACAGLNFGETQPKDDGSGSIVAGSPNDDALVGTSGDDIICPFGGDDTVDAGDGDDQVLASKGADDIVGRAGGDSLEGGAGKDTLNGGKGADTLEGGDGNDVAAGGDGKDNVKGNAGIDTLRGKGGADSLQGGDGQDVLKGGGGGDSLRGGAGADQIDGGSGRDSCQGGPGRDHVVRCEE